MTDDIEGPVSDGLLIGVLKGDADIIELNAPHLKYIAANIRQAADALSRFRDANNDATEPQGHNKPCYYCGAFCDSFSCKPSLWPIPLCHADDPGVTKWHHTSCVSERLLDAERFRDAGRELPADALRMDIIPSGPVVQSDGLFVYASEYITLRTIATAAIAELAELKNGLPAHIINTSGVTIPLDKYNDLISAKEFRDSMLRKDTTWERPYVCRDCGNWELIERCTKFDGLVHHIQDDGTPYMHWRCHKFKGHGGACATHMECGERNSEGGICADYIDHPGPHWSNKVNNVAAISSKYEAERKLREKAEKERDRLSEDSVRQAATINRLAIAAEDRNKVDEVRQQNYDTDLQKAEARAERLEKALSMMLNDDGSEGEQMSQDEVEAFAREALREKGAGDE